MAKKAIVIKDILDLLADGKSRKEINEIYGFNPAEANFVWGNEKLKGVKKAKYSIGIELVDEPAVIQDGGSPFQPTGSL